MFRRRAAGAQLCLWLALTTVATVGGCAAAAPPRAPAPASPVVATVTQTVSVGQSVWVTVAVATLWVSPTSPRSVDAPALAAPVRMTAWLNAMSTTQRRGLVGRVETESLYGERLLVTGVRSGWLHIVAVGQPTRRDARGYPGWVPTRQVTTHHPVSTTYVATVVKRLTHLRTPSGVSSIWLSFGTRLPVKTVGSTRTTVFTPTGGRLTVANADIVRRLSTARPLPLTAASVLASARLFVGAPYLWGARSGWAVDCSGFTNIVYGVHGVRLPRDADDQTTRGRAVSNATKRPGDLIFFKHGSVIDHVGFYLGAGMLLHAPHTGAFVGTISLTKMTGLTAIRRFI